MPKLDKSRNYYADLELSTTASADDIKKQYRKLGAFASICPSCATRLVST